MSVVVVPVGGPTDTLTSLGAVFGVVGVGVVLEFGGIILANMVLLFPTGNGKSFIPEKYIKV